MTWMWVNFFFHFACMDGCLDETLMSTNTISSTTVTIFLTMCIDVNDSYDSIIIINF